MKQNLNCFSQEVGLGDYNDFSSISEKDMKMER